MRKKISMMLILVLALSVFAVACGGGEDEALYEDGTYTAESDFDENGWKGIIEIEIEDGKIDSVDYEEYDEDGNEKSEDEEYGEMMKDASGVSPEEAFEQLEELLEDKQNPEEVDTVAGATGTSTQFVELAEEALKEASK